MTPLIPVLRETTASRACVLRFTGKRKAFSITRVFGVLITEKPCAEREHSSELPGDGVLIGWCMKKSRMCSMTVGSNQVNTALTDASN